MRAPVPRASDLGDASVRGEDQDGGHLALKGAVQEGERLNVEHVALVDKENAGNNVGFTFLAPLGNLGVDLLANLSLDLARVAGKESQKALRARVDHVDLVQRDGVDNLFALLELTLGGLHKARLRAHRVVVAAPREAPAKLRNAASGLVNGDHVTLGHLLLGEGLDHLGTKIVHGLHLSRLERELPNLALRAPILLNNYHFRNRENEMKRKKCMKKRKMKKSFISKV